jgi:hypothetical protein
MGTELKPQVEVVRKFLEVGARLSLDPDVDAALQQLYRAVDATADDTGCGLIALLTMVAATRGVTGAIKGQENEAELFQLSLLRSVYATHLMHTRVLH